MIIRRIQLKNNLYIDNDQVKNTGKPLGEYCVFGYFDAMNISQVYSGQSGAWKISSDGVIREMDGRYAVRSLLCVSGDCDKDAAFWQNNSSFPLMFVSIIRLREPKNSSDVVKSMDRINQSDNKMAYFSYEHSELIVFMKTKSYSEGHNFSKELHGRFDIYKMYTIFSVKEAALESYNVIKREIIDCRVDCRLRAIVKSWNRIDTMKKELQQALEVSQISARHMMGNADVLLEINDVSLHKLLVCYKMNELLTHSNPIYNAVFHNVETEILLAEAKNG